MLPESGACHHVKITILNPKIPIGKSLFTGFPVIQVLFVFSICFSARASAAVNLRAVQQPEGLPQCWTPITAGNRAE